MDFSAGKGVMNLFLPRFLDFLLVLSDWLMAGWLGGNKVGVGILFCQAFCLSLVYGLWMDYFGLRGLWSVFLILGGLLSSALAKRTGRQGGRQVGRFFTWHP